MKKIRKFMMALAMMVLMFGLTIVGASKVQAANPFIQKSATYYLYENKITHGGIISIYGQVPNAKITNLKNSNPNVVKLNLNQEYGIIGYTILKEGISKVSFRYAGKTLTQKITVVKYENPCQSFKVGNTNYTKYFKKSRHFNHNNRKKDITATIKVTPKKGWKLTKIEVQNIYDGTKKVKNNSKIKLSIKGTGTGVHAYFKNIKTGIVEELFLGYGGGNFPNENIYD